MKQRRKKNKNKKHKVQRSFLLGLFERIQITTIWCGRWRSKGGATFGALAAVTVDLRPDSGLLSVLEVG